MSTPESVIIGPIHEAFIKCPEGDGGPHLDYQWVQPEQSAHVGKACPIARHVAVGPCMALYRAVESRPVMAARMMTRKCVGRKSIRVVPVAAVSDAAADRRTGPLQRGPVGRQSGSRSWSPTIQNVQIGIIERERARLLDGGPHGPVRIEVVLRIIPGVA
jgi:hypothetical protein